MPTISKIAVCVPEPENTGEYFTLKIKQELLHERSTFSAPFKILVLPEIKGNFKVMRDLLIRCGVINKYYRWTFGDGHILLPGNCLQDNAGFIECLWLIYGLEGQAHKNGGYIHYLLGGDELLHMRGDWRFTHPHYAKKEVVSLTRYAMLYDGNSELYRWLLTKNLVEKIGDNLFVNGTLLNYFAEAGISIAEFNRRSQRYHMNSLHRAADTEDMPVNPLLQICSAKRLITTQGNTSLLTIIGNKKRVTLASGSEALLIIKDHYYRISDRKERIVFS